MKNSILLTPILFLILSCGSYPYGQRTQGSNILSERNEDGEYELIIIDPGYDRWMTRYAKPANYYSLNYYEQKNQVYVASWNSLVGNSAYFKDENYPFEMRIDYNAYGLELNYKLFTYFQYIEDVYGDRYRFPS
ncbi:DUF6146 family protein [Fulvivirga ligni]|uniref:DUF6146 family protein n=1 Tax=Fulvivirga ligni TaxID=2904246 RepID=UPI001F474DA1|nr:DUF6146 family protein [Fulvivirga ligni]UII19774.1 DUF6146 family protein [Fulvivirga ligni]